MQFINTAAKTVQEYLKELPPAEHREAINAVRGVVFGSLIPEVPRSLYAR
jgi:hypothetical protein